MRTLHWRWWSQPRRALAERLRGDLEPDEPRWDVIGVAVKTMEPASAPVWITGEDDES